MNTVIDLAGAIASLFAAAIAIIALRVARQTFRRDHRPIVRVVATYRPGAQGHEPPPEHMQMDTVILKNIGRGPGLTAIAFDPTRELVMGDVEVVEPLGSGDQEENRSGRLRVPLRRPMEMDGRYELYCQDVLGDWHLTRFRPRPWRIECSFVPQVKESKVPGSVKHLATVARP